MKPKVLVTKDYQLLHPEDKAYKDHYGKHKEQQTRAKNRRERKRKKR
jgi:hypothetical protein